MIMVLQKASAQAMHRRLMGMPNFSFSPLLATLWTRSGRADFVAETAQHAAPRRRARSLSS
jgi:hypothetical protein